MEYTALFEPDQEAGGFVITFPDLDFGVTQGDTEEEALDMATDLLICILQELIQQGQELPKPKKYRGRNYRAVVLPTMPALKAELYSAFQASGIRKTELAHQLNIHKANLDRLFDLRHQSRMDHI